MKVVLKTGEELQINSAFPTSDTQISISFKGITSIDGLLTKLTVSALKQVSVYNTEDSVNLYLNYTKVNNPSMTKAEDGTWDVVVILEREDEMSQRVRQLEEDSLTSLLAITELYELILTIQGV